MEQRIEAERARGDRAGSGAVHERQDFVDAESQTRRELETMRVQLAARQEVIRAAEAIRQTADDARRALGRWARLKRAWRGQ